MHYKLLLLLIFIVTGFPISAQGMLSEETIKSRLTTPYENYFAVNREMIYTQFNKSRYIIGEDIWFTSWILNPENKRLSLTTTKLYVELWSCEKKLVSRKIILVNGGTGSNYIHILDTLLPGTYCFRAYTNWMRNFYDENEFNTQLTIMGPASKTIRVKDTVTDRNTSTTSNESGKIKSKSDYDIQFLPESGHFVEGVDNIFGVKITDPYGHGYMGSGKIVDSLNNEVLNFTTNQLGITNFTLKNTPCKRYKAIVELPNGINHDILLPDPEKLGVVININDLLPNVIWFRFQTNLQTQLLHQSYFLMVHSEGIIYGNFKIGFTANTDVLLNLNRKEMGNGVMYATLFNQDLAPVAERIFYNQNGSSTGRISLSAISILQDSVKLSITTSDSLLNPQITKFSVSVMPDGTTMNRFTSNLLSESRLHPVLKGIIENEAWYFEKPDMERTIALDDLMLTQGWRKYNWPDICRNENKKYPYLFETGFIVNGYLKNWLGKTPGKKSRVSLISPMNSILTSTIVDSVGKFSFTNLYLADSSEVSISAASLTGTNMNQTLQVDIPEVHLNTPEFKPAQEEAVKYEEHYEDIPKTAKGTILLPGVVIVAKQKNPFENNIEVGIMAKQFILTEENSVKYNDVQQILQTVFNVTINQNGSNYSIGMGRGSSGNPRIIIDGMPQPNLDDVPSFVREQIIEDLIHFPLNSLDAIAVDKSGGSGGIGGANGVIVIKSRTTPLFKRNDDSFLLKKIIVKGYAMAKEYFEPKYIIEPDNINFLKYVALYWKPDLLTNVKGNATITFKVPQSLKSILVRIEGINSNGLIFEKEEKIVLK